MYTFSLQCSPFFYVFKHRATDWLVAFINSASFFGSIFILRVRVHPKHGGAWKIDARAAWEVASCWQRENCRCWLANGLQNQFPFTVCPRPARRGSLGDWETGSNYCECRDMTESLDQHHREVCLSCKEVCNYLHAARGMGCRCRCPVGVVTFTGTGLTVALMTILLSVRSISTV